MGPPVDAVPCSETLPDSTEVLIIGGGIIGVSAALTLAERGIPVVICEKGEIGAEQSSRNWGWCRQQGRDPRELPLVIASLTRWADMDQRTGEATGFTRCGTLILAEDERALESRQAWLVHARTFDINAQLIGAKETGALLPGTNRTWAGALHCASDGRAEPSMAAPAIARAAQRAGAFILTNTAVRGLESVGGDSQLVVTERGAIRAQSVLIAGGAWSRLFCRNLGIVLPQLKIRASVFRTAPHNNGPDSCVSGPDFSLRRRLDGGYTVASGSRSRIDLEIVPDAVRFLPAYARLAWMVRSHLRIRRSSRFAAEWREPTHWALDTPSPFESQRILDPTPLASSIERAHDGLVRDFPSFHGVPIAQRWAGMIDVTPDAVPVISGVDSHPGLYIATGFSGHGFGIGPAAGELAADLMTGASPLVDPTPFRFSRFSDGSPIQPIVGI
jgi:glycine/D-amino acid oxidase-like deaminating enzyme